MNIGIPNMSINDTYVGMQETVPTPPSLSSIVLEDGYNMLQEDGGYLLTEIQ